MYINETANKHLTWWCTRWQHTSKPKRAASTRCSAKTKISFNRVLIYLCLILSRNFNLCNIEIMLSILISSTNKIGIVRREIITVIDDVFCYIIVSAQLSFFSGEEFAANYFSFRANSFLFTIPCDTKIERENTILNFIRHEAHEKLKNADRHQQMALKWIANNSRRRMKHGAENQ